MFKPVKAENIEEYLAMLPDDRRQVIKYLDSFIKNVAPTLKPFFAYNMLGYGSFKYQNYKKESVNWPTVSLASQKNYLTLYVCSVENGEYIAEKYKNELGNVRVGKSCIRFKKIEDLNLKTLEKVIKLAEKSPGLVGVGAH
jgi:uncharacterized protein YdhG (YjbR/CyaY superfamily)